MDGSGFNGLIARDPPRAADLSPDLRLIERLGLAVCLREDILPGRDLGGAVLIHSGRAALPAALLALIEGALGPVCISVTDPVEIRRCIASQLRETLLARAQSRTASPDSCRSLGTSAARGMSALLVLTLAAVIAAWPVTALLVLTAIAVLALTLTSALRLAVGMAALWRTRVPDRKAEFLRLPVITIFVPLFREEAVAEHLLTRLSALDYPRDRIDLCLIVEERDTVTLRALRRATVPSWARLITVPHADLRTKPRAMNYALDFARGDIVGIYDAEDAPAPDQLRVIANRFANAPQDVACLQGILDFYNPRRNWLSRCFTIEYASWFRMTLPGLARLGLIMPLGGTTLFFRRDVLEEIGAWDAHNVTEDADLGVRLARRGYRTEFVETVTGEEANAAAWPWVKQRSRWLKGYAMTWAVHTRAPVRAIRELGLVRFLSMQVLLLGTLVQFALAPLLWSLWLIPLGLPHPLPGLIPGGFWLPMLGLFLCSEATTLVLGALAVRAAGKSFLIPWVPVLHLYYPLATLAVIKGLSEIVFRPFYWDKTIHGGFGGAG